jgi:hypothetical protein
LQDIPIHGPGDVRKDERALKEAIAPGERLCDLIRILKRGVI